MSEKEETRKIQFTGNSSYIVSLPKRWVTDLGLRRGDQIRITRNSSTLQIFPPQVREGGAPKEDATIEIRADEDPQPTVRRLISLYFLGFRTIHVVPKEGWLRPEQRASIKEAVRRMLMGTEIISDSRNGMTLQVLVSLLELTVDGAFKRMIHLAKMMLSDAIAAVERENLALAREVIDTDDEVDRFGFYIIRQLKMAIQNEHMLKEVGFRDARSCLGYRLVVKSIERTGDHASLIARDLLEYGGVGGPTMSKIKEMSQFAVSLLDDACLSLFTEDYEQAEKTIKSSEEISAYETRVMETTKKTGEPGVYRIRRTTENIRRIAEYASDIAEIVLNMTIEKTLKKA
ncbi:phosphate uptake regulator [Cenarchaeum symbiosum A]|uniref:Phosphate uptake regulator n=1 Tax=Cenarchaeum symbiosum (strain A) TaxID=414004 RepID=A0RYD3_CENSY|nr:phosphate uptake regulator [Cenarchaeum symbiosum A]